MIGNNYPFICPTVLQPGDLIKAGAATPTCSLHDIRLCDHVNTRREQCQELMKMEKTQDARQSFKGFVKLLTAGGSTNRKY